MLAGLVKAPSRLAPNRNPDAAQARAELVLAAMVDAGLHHARQTKARPTAPGQAAVRQRRRLGQLCRRLGRWTCSTISSATSTRTSSSTTTIDRALQAPAERAVVDELDAKGRSFDVQQGALVAHASGRRRQRAWSAGATTQTSQFNRAIAARRQPGSAFKPFVYLTAIETRPHARHRGDD